MKDVYSEIKMVRALTPQTTNSTGAITTMTGSIIDRKDYATGLLSVLTGAIGTTIDQALLSLNIYHGDSSTLSDTALYSSSTVTALTCITAGHTISNVSLDFAMMKRYIRLTAVSSFTWTAGTTPTYEVAATLAMGQTRWKPPA